MLCQCDSWEAASKRIETSLAQAAIEEMHEKDEEGHTAFAFAIVGDSPFALLESMFELGKQDTMEREIVTVSDKEDYTTLQLAVMHRTDAAATKLLAREDPRALHWALHHALEYNKKSNKKSTAVVSLQRKCLTAMEHGNISALIDLCGESDTLLLVKKYVERHQVHHVAMHASDIVILKPVICDHTAHLLIKDEDGNGLRK